MKTRDIIATLGAMAAAIVIIVGLGLAAALREWLFLPIVAIASVVIGLLAAWSRRTDEIEAAMQRHPAGKAVGRAPVPLRRASGTKMLMPCTRGGGAP